MLNTEFYFCKKYKVNRSEDGGKKPFHSINLSGKQENMAANGRDFTEPFVGRVGKLNKGKSLNYSESRCQSVCYPGV
jgi:hypothetical protein